MKGFPSPSAAQAAGETRFSGRALGQGGPFRLGPLRQRGMMGPKSPASAGKFHDRTSRLPKERWVTGVGVAPCPSAGNHRGLFLFSGPKERGFARFFEGNYAKNCLSTPMANSRFVSFFRDDCQDRK